MSKPTYYEQFEISNNASPEMIHAAYKVLAKKFHPDLCGLPKEQAEAIMKEINAIYATLSDPEKRKRYDQYLKAEQEQQTETSNHSNYQPSEPQSTYQPPKPPQKKPLKSDKTFWSMLVLFAVLPLVFVLCLIWYFSTSYDNSTPAQKPPVETSSPNIQTDTYPPQAETSETKKDYSAAIAEMKRRREENPNEYIAPDGFAEGLLASMQNSNNPQTTDQPQPKPTPSTTFSVGFTYKVVDSNLVGNNWSCIYSIDGDGLYIGNTLAVSIGSVIRITATATENDNSKDVGSNSISRTISKDDINNGFTTSFYVYVKEDRGRYAGNTATIKVKLTFIPNT